MSQPSTVIYDYSSGDWPDQLVKYGSQTISYDGMGNPMDYINGMHFEWKRGRQLSKISFNDENSDNEDDKEVTYKYNENGLRTYKDASKISDTTTTYEWDGNTLIREKVTYNTTNKTYDIWYFYDGMGNILGYEYNYVNDQNEKASTRVYYEKDLQGNVIGLLNDEGVEFATYSYDAWGNVTDTVCNEGYETAYNLNHIMYRGYYRDVESGLYYLQSRYYDPVIGRFIRKKYWCGCNISGIGICRILIFKYAVCMENSICCCNIGNSYI